MIKKKLFIFRISLFALLIFLFNSSVFSQVYTIKMNLNPGDTFNYNMTMNMGISTQGMDIRMDIETGCLFKVISNNDSKELQMSYTKMNMSTDMNGGPANSVSDSILKAVTKQFIGKSVILKFSDDNQVTEVIGLDSLMVNSEQSEIYQQTVKQLFSKDQINNLFGIMFSMYPKNPVKIGDSWNVDPTVNVNGINMTINITYTLAEIKNGLANITLDAVINSKGEIKNSTMDIPVTMNGTEKGTIAINLSDGYMHNAAYKMDLDAVMEASGQKIPMTLKGDYLLTGN
jgi:hypothetical protein